MIATRIDIELAGRGQGWTDLTPHVAGSVPIECEYGISGTGPADRVASPGSLTFALHNALRSNGVATGYYAPNHAAKRAGFDLGCRVRWVCQVGATSLYKFVGKIDRIVPDDTGASGPQLTHVTAVDWLEEAANWPVPPLPLLEHARGDEAFAALVAACPDQPNAIEVAGVGQDTYRYCFDNLRGSAVPLLTELQRLALSGGDYIYLKGDAAVGGVLTYEPRTVRGRTSANLVTFRDTGLLESLEFAVAREHVVTTVHLVIHPRAVDPAATSALFRLRNPIKVQPGETFTLLCAYYDPSSQAEKVGGVDMKSPLTAPDDWTANTAADGSGADRASDFTVVPSYGSNGASIAITNAGSTAAYLTSLVLTGRGIYDYANVTVASTDAGRAVAYGDRVASLSMPYQADPAVAQDLAAYIRSLWSSPAAHVIGATVSAAVTEDAHALTLLQREPSDRVGLVEAISGINTTTPTVSGCRGFFIHRLHYTVTPARVTLRLSLAPADAAVYWRLEVPGQSELDWTTRLAYFSAVGHVDLAHGDAHDDTAHGDVPHSDSHTDEAHADAAHADAVHADIAHVDTSHADTAHVDAAYLDSHTDTAHADSHSDGAHADTAHVDTAHGDQAHADQPHVDAHYDTAHSDTHADQAYQDHYDELLHYDEVHYDEHWDTAHQDITVSTEHADVAHTDSPHVDTHTDTAHADGHADGAHVDAHADEAHADTAHADVAHTDVTHGDAGHADSGHADVAHADVAHGDSYHADTTHVDTHKDTAHGDA